MNHPNRFLCISIGSIFLAIAGGTEVALEQCQEGIWYCELNKNKVVEKQLGGTVTDGKCPERELQ
ncbi:MAG: hypothetical protein ACI8TX_003417 [Hyphomicrobiaceae bacterium]|jgi:hypothetical protein